VASCWRLQIEILVRCRMKSHASPFAPVICALFCLDTIQFDVVAHNHLSPTAGSTRRAQWWCINLFHSAKSVQEASKTRHRAEQPAADCCSWVCYRLYPIDMQNLSRPLALVNTPYVHLIWRSRNSLRLIYGARYSRSKGLCSYIFSLFIQLPYAAREI